MSNQINICLACDKNYAKYAGVVIASVLYNAENNDNYNFYIIHNGLSENWQNEILSLKNIKNYEIKFIEVNDNSYSDYKNIQTNKYLSIAACYRLKLPSLLPSINKIIYLDCDVIVNSNIANLYKIEIGHNLIAGIKDICAPFEGYINSGVVIFNLEQMRQENIEEKFLYWTRRNAEIITCGDQEIINETCKGRSLVIDDKTWNVQTSEFSKRSYFTNNPKIIHYIGKYKPWTKYSLCYYKEYFRKYLQLTPWAMNAKELFFNKYIEQPLSILRYPLKKPFFWLSKNFYNALFQNLLLVKKGGIDNV